MQWLGIVFEIIREAALLPLFFMLSQAAQGSEQRLVNNTLTGLAVVFMLNLLAKCFPSKIAGWEPRIKELIPGYGVKLNDNPDLADEVMAHTAKVLGIHN